MSPAITFFLGIGLLVLFGWYFGTEAPTRKRWLGLVLSVLLVAFCLEEALPPSQKIALGIDLRGGTSFRLKLNAQEGERITPALLDQAVEVIRKRVDSLGVGEPVITPQGEDSILVQIPEVDANNVESYKKILQQVAKLEFSTVAPGGEARIARIESGQEVRDPSYVIKEYHITTESGQTVATKLMVKKRPEMNGEHVKQAYAGLGPRGWEVDLSLDGEGAKQFDNIAAQHQGEPLAIILDGEIINAPTLNESAYHGRASLTGHYTEKEARDLASALENPLRVPVSVEEIRSVSSSLGTDSIKSGVLSGLSGLVLVLLFVMIYYRFAGLIAFVGLLVNIVILFGLMAMFHLVLTLPGIAGVILTIGLAVDANVLIYERLREELHAGKSVAAALETAYNKAFSAIFDANFTTLITAVILFWQAIGSVKGFAVTLTLGIVASMFSALLVTRTIFRWLVEKGALKKLSMLDLIPKKQFDFLGKRWIAAVVSIVLIGGSIGVFALRGEKNFGIDFRGGDLLIVDARKPLDVGAVRNALSTNERNDVVIQYERQGTQSHLTIRSPQGTAAGILDELKKKFPENGITVIAQENVGPQIGQQFAKKSLYALLLGSLGILIYVTLRFEFSFALGALVALIHDVVITVGIFALLGGELSLVMVGAILTIAGYSINDTIVVYDRIRENLKLRQGGNIQTLMNTAINETLGRTILTGGTTLLSVSSLFFFGGAVLRDFSFAILIGILVGTYSSVFIASPIVLWWSKIRGQSIRREVLAQEAKA